MIFAIIGFIGIFISTTLMINSADKNNGKEKRYSFLTGASLALFVVSIALINFDDTPDNHQKENHNEKIDYADNS